MSKLLRCSENFDRLAVGSFDGYYASFRLGFHRAFGNIFEPAAHICLSSGRYSSDD
jgi:hypothetical protein